MRKSKSIPILPNAPATISAEQLAGLSNLTKRRLYQLADEHKIPQPTNGCFPMLETLTALFSYYQRDGADLQREKLLKTAAERKLREHELALVEGKHLKKSDVERDAVGLGRRLNAGLDRWLELRLRVMAMAKFNQRPVTPPLAPEQLTQVVEVICEIGVETNLALKDDLRASLGKLK